MNQLTYDTFQWKNTTITGVASSKGVRILTFGNPDSVLERFRHSGEDLISHQHKWLEECWKQLDEYFQGNRTVFTMALDYSGTAFQQAVWQKLTEIPYGKVTSYGFVAAAVGNPAACRAVGMANSRNPVGIVIPCHRVVGSTGALTGYSSGLSHKVSLLELEGVHITHDRILEENQWYNFQR